MPHLLALCFEVVPAGFVGTGDTGNALGNDDSGFFQRPDLIGIIRQQTHRFDAQMSQNRARQMVAAQVALEAELFIGLDGVGPMILQLISPQFVHEPYAAAFLELIDDEPAPFARNLGERNLELRATIAAQTVKDVAGEALRMDSQQRRGVGTPNVPHDERDRFFEMGAAVGQAEAALETIDTEGPVFGGEIGLGCPGEFKLQWGRNNFIIMNRQAWNST